mmetsp:Transcript_23883/g.35040  ORF Transcript_23883/g.35040 Transcript_23883/m.35040 type:complete len:267 (-) Transcript_23883:847-1647(-)
MSTSTFDSDTTAAAYVGLLSLVLKSGSASAFPESEKVPYSAEFPVASTSSTLGGTYWFSSLPSLRTICAVGSSDPTSEPSNWSRSTEEKKQRPHPTPQQQHPRTRNTGIRIMNVENVAASRRHTRSTAIKTGNARVQQTVDPAASNSCPCCAFIICAGSSNSPFSNAASRSRPSSIDAPQRRINQELTISATKYIHTGSSTRPQSHSTRPSNCAARNRASQIRSTLTTILLRLMACSKSFLKCSVSIISAWTFASWSIPSGSSSSV